jgi:hypothetical protein
MVIGGSFRDEAAVAAVLELAQAIAIESGQRFCGQDVVDRAGLGPAIAEDEQGTVTEAVGERRVVQDHEHGGATIPRRAAEEFEDRHLVAEIEV